MLATTPDLPPSDAVFAFAGSGLLYPYYFGILTVLLQHGYIVPGVTPLAGISGGAITASVGCSGAAPVAALNYLVAALQQHPQDFWAAREGILLGLANLTAPGSYDSCSAKLHVAMSQLDEQSDSLNGSTPLVVSEFRSDEDMWAAVVGSSTIACAGYDPAAPYNGGPPYVQYRGVPVVDGGYSADLSTLCGALGLPYGAPGSRCVTIAAFEPGPFREGDGCDVASREVPCQRLPPPPPPPPPPSHSVDPSRHDAPLSPAAPRGQAAADARSAPQSRASGQLPSDCSAFPGGRGLPDFRPAFDPQGSDNSDNSSGSSGGDGSAAGWPSLCPGCDPRNPLPYSRRDWQRMSLDGAAAFPHLRKTFQIGARDAELWVADRRK